MIIYVVQVKEAEEIERVQRITEDKKHYVHEELLRKAIQKEVQFNCISVSVIARPTEQTKPIKVNT